MTMWPVMLDMPRDECKRQLRRLELDAYATVMTAFRAQGNLDTSRKQILKDLQSVLSISSERHRAEVRRAVNDERLYTIAAKMGCASESNEKWMAEGRRLVPLLPRLVPQTAFTAAATNAANLQAERNLAMCPPAETPFQEASVGSSGLSAATPISHGGGASHVGGANHGGGASFVSGASGSVNSAGNVVVLPNGMSIHIKGGGDTDVDLPQPPGGKRRRRSSSTESLLVGRQLPPTSSMRPVHPPVSNTTQSITPMKMGLAKGQLVKGVPTQAQKVIIVSGAAAGVPPTVLPKINMGAKSVVTATASATSLISHVKAARPSGSGGVMVPGKTVATTVGLSTGGSSLMTTYSSSQICPPKPVQYSRGTMVIPGGSPMQQSTPVTFHNMHGKVTPKPTIHIKQEGSMKIITQAVPTVSTSKPSTVTMATKTTNIGVTSIASGKMLSLSTAGHRLITASSMKTASPNIVTVNPRKLQFATIKGPPGNTVLTANRLDGAGGGKSNVFVVQKAGKKLGPSTAIHVTTTVPSAISSAFEKELVSFIQKQDSHQKQLLVAQQKTGVEKTFKPRQGVDTARQPLLVKRNPAEGSTAGRSSLLAELIHAAGIVPDTKTGGLDDDTGSSDTPKSSVDTVMLSKDGASSSKTWVEYDMSGESGQMTQMILDQTGDLSESLVKGQTLDPATLKAILQLATSQSRTATVTTTPRKTQLDLTQLPSKFNCSQSEVYIIGESGQLAPVSVLSGQSSTDQEPVTMLADDYVVDSDTVTLVEPPSVTSDQSTIHMEQIIIDHQTTVESEREEVVVERGIMASPEDVTVGGVATVGGVSDAMTGGMATEMIDSGGGACCEEEVVGELDQRTGLFYVRQASSELVSDSVVEAPASMGPAGASEMDTERAPGFTTPMEETPGSDVVDSVEPTESSLMSQVDTPEPVTVATSLELAPPELTEGQDLLHTALSHAHIDQGDSQDAPTPVSGSIGPAPPAQFISILTPSVSQTTSVAPSAVTRPASNTEQSVSSPDSDIAASVSAKVTDSVTVSPMESVVTRTVTGQVSSAVTRPCNVTVTVEPSGLDTAHMKIEDFASQRLDPTDLVSYSEDMGPHIGEETERSDATLRSDTAIRPVSLSDSSHPWYKRKRKMSQTSDAWIKHAFGLLQRVCRFRGVNKEKGEMNAASWFTRPVSPKAVPDYYQVIQRPMDFGTIRKKLESSQYTDWSDLHADMLLVRQNCHQYNLPGTKVRYDCDQVFDFYLTEYNKVTGSQASESSPSSKAARHDTSPS